MPRTEHGDALHAMKYRSPGEDFREAMNRVAFALKDSDNHYHEFREILLDQRFMPAGRIQAAMGSSKFVTAYNCYVSGSIADSFTDDMGSIMQRAHEAAKTMRMGGGIGYDFSTLRPRGELIAKLQSAASGPVSFMHIYDAVCLATSSSGHRRGAQMAVLRVDHPDIEEFIHAKNNDDKLRGFNISVAVTDEFMESVAAGTEFPLRFNNKVYRYIDAQALWENIMRSTWDWAEPGVLFIDTINRMNNLKYCETIAATNPCGEQPLPPFGACLLGSFNLVKYLKSQPARPGCSPWYFDFEQLWVDIEPVVRGIDNVIDRSRYPLPEQKVEALSKRRMGLGITGFANAAEACGYPYGSPECLHFEGTVLSTLLSGAYRASAKLAEEKGPFTLYDERFLQGEFVKVLDDETQAMIRKHGIRNSHLTSIAPTGTISMAADNVSSSIEPVFFYETERQINTPNGQVTKTIRDYGVEFLNVRGKLSADVSVAEHLNVLTTAQAYVDSACSKTINMDGNKMSWDDFKDIYRIAWENGAKGCTTFNSSGQRFGIMTEAKSDPDGLTCEIDENGRRSCE